MSKPNEKTPDGAHSSQPLVDIHQDDSVELPDWATKDAEMVQQLMAWGEAHPLTANTRSKQSRPAASGSQGSEQGATRDEGDTVPSGGKSKYSGWPKAILTIMFLAAFAGVSVYAITEGHARRHSELARDLHEAKSRAEIRVRALIERARWRLDLPKFGRITETRQLLLEAGESLRTLEDDKVIRELELQIRSTFVATLSLVDVRPREITQLAADPFLLWPIACHGNSIAIATTKGIVVWKRSTKLAEADKLRPLKGARLLYSPDGTYLALLSPKGSLELWDKEATIRWAKFELKRPAPFLAAGFLPGGKSIRACTSDGQVSTWDIPSRKQTDGRAADVKGMGTLTAASFDTTGERLLVGDEDGQVRLLPVEGREGLKLPPMNSRVASLAWSPEGGRFAIGCMDGSVLLLRSNGAPLLSLPGLDWVDSLAFSADGRMLCGGQRNGPGYLWDTETGERLQVRGTPVGVSSDGVLAVTSTSAVAFDALIRPTTIVPYAGHRGTPVRLAWSGATKGKDHFFATLDAAFHVRVWKAGQPRPLLVAQMPWKGYFAMNGSVALSKDAKHVAFASGGPAASVARILEVATGKLVAEWMLPGGYETLLAGGGDRFLLLREESAEGKSALRTAVYELVPGRPAKVERVLREPGPHDEAGYYSARVAGEVYMWIGPREPLSAGRVEIRDITTGKVIAERKLGGYQGVSIDEGGKALWVYEPENKVLKYDLTKPLPGVRADRMPFFMSTDGKWGGYPPRNPGPHELEALVLERSGKPFITIGGGSTTARVEFLGVSSDGRFISWGHQQGAAVIADLPALEGAIDTFMRELRR